MVLETTDTSLAGKDAEGVTTSTPEFRRRFLIRLTAVLIGGMFLDGYILGIIGPATVLIQSDLGVSDLRIGLIAAGTLFGIFVGAPIGGWMTDKFGRKPMFLIDMGLFVIASFLQFFVALGQFFITSALQLLIIRFLMGISRSAASTGNVGEHVGRCRGRVCRGRAVAVARARDCGQEPRRDGFDVLTLISDRCAKSLLYVCARLLLV